MDKTGILAATDGIEEGSPARQHIDGTIAAAQVHPGIAAGQAQAPKVLTASEALRQKHIHLAGITLLATQFGGKIVDISNDAVIVELAAKTARIDSFLKLVRPYGILEAARSGASLAHVKITTVLPTHAVVVV